jgi:hypothetical protein
MVVKRCIQISLLLAMTAGSAVQAQLGAFTPTLTISPRQPTTTDRVVVHAVVASDYPLSFSGIDRSGNTFTLHAGQFALSPLPPPTTYTADFDLGVLSVGSYRVELGDSSVAFSVAPPNILVLGDRFWVGIQRDATLSDLNGGESATPVKLTGDSGYFWFFDSGNIEVTVKILDGSAVNGHFWLFAASMTDRPFVIKVYDTQGYCGISPCFPKLYINPGGQNQNFIDVRAFTTSGVEQPGVP